MESKRAELGDSMNQVLDANAELFAFMPGGEELQRAPLTNTFYKLKCDIDAQFFPDLPLELDDWVRSLLALFHTVCS